MSVSALPGSPEEPPDTRGSAPVNRSRVYGAALSGVDAILVEVEVDLLSLLPMFQTVGLPDSAVREARERVRCVISGSGERFPSRRITVNLAPADLPKDGSGFDLPIAVGVLAADGRVPEAAASRWLMVGELALSGALRPVRGALAAAQCARASGLEGIILPFGNADEAAISGIQVVPAPDLRAVLDFLRGERTAEGLTALLEENRTVKRVPGAWSGISPDCPPEPLDLADVRGSLLPRRAMEVAAAGGHNILLVGPPGCGKSMLARRLPGLLPDLDEETAQVVTRVHSAAGLLPPGSGLLRRPPFRSPHHTISPVALAGGGSRIRPGEVSLAHGGVLFLDELPEFPRSALEVLRQPLEEGVVHIARSRERVSLPSRVQLVATMNPCPCGWWGQQRRPCRCGELAARRYQSRLSGPLLDRIDLQVLVPPLSFDEMEGPQGEATSSVARRVAAARLLQDHRGAFNGSLSGRTLLTSCDPDDEGRALLRRILERGMLSARARDSTLRVARTIADLEGAAQIRGHYVAEAVTFRALDWGQGTGS